MSASSGAVSLSVLVPNYNYARYIAETLRSVLGQVDPSTEVIVCDNASTDDSVAVVESLRDPRVHVSVNPCNVGFAANLERVALQAKGRRMLLLSSDDRMGPGAFAAYRALEAALGPSSEQAVWGASSAVIDSRGLRTGMIEPDRKLWREARPEPALSAAVGHPVRSIKGPDLLRRSLELLRSPLPFATTCYPRALHDRVGGYAGGRLMNPDKWFLWKLLAVTERAYVIDAPLFDYRVHGAGQNAQEAAAGALKHLTDEYIATFNLPDTVLASAGLTRDALARAFIEQDIALRGLVAVANGQRAAARRMLHFGAAAYPALIRENHKIWALHALLALGPVGSKLARAARGWAEERWAARQSEPGR